jgi:hypothetical protein
MRELNAGCLKRLSGCRMNGVFFDGSWREPVDLEGHERGVCIDLILNQDGALIAISNAYL